MRNLIPLAFGLSVMFTLSAAAQQPTKQQIADAKATYSGTLDKKGAKVPWACTATVQGEGSVRVKWSDSEVTYTGDMGPAGGKAGAPITMNAQGADGSQVRFQWNTLDKLQVEWWPNMAAKAGQKENKPAEAKGTIPRQK